MVTVYVMGADPGLKKLGFAINPDRRRSRMQTGSAVPLSLLHKRVLPPSDAAPVEAYAHWLLRDRRKHGEWFDVTLPEAVAAIESAVDAVARGERMKRSGVGRKQINHEQMPARLPAGTIARIVSVLRPSESKSDFLREAVENELTRRSAIERELTRRERKG